MRLLNLTSTSNALKSLGVLLSMSLLAACSSKTDTSREVDTSNYAQLAELTQKNTPEPTTATNQIRIEAIKDTAMQLGAQGGLAWRSAQINKELEAEATHLRNVFNFNALIMENGILPPVLMEGNKTLNQSGPLSIRITDKTYTIEANARFVTAPPTWRDYLITHFKKPDLPNAVLLPKDSKEEDMWREYLAIGWKNGVAQADNIYSENLAKLKRDYEGMILYRKLLAMHMVTPPYIAKTDLGVTGDATHLNIGDKVLRISALPGMNVDSKEWKAYVVEE